MAPRTPGALSESGRSGRSEVGGARQARPGECHGTRAHSGPRWPVVVARTLLPAARCGAARDPGDRDGGSRRTGEHGRSRTQALDGALLTKAALRQRLDVKAGRAADAPE